MNLFTHTQHKLVIFQSPLRFKSNLLIYTLRLINIAGQIAG